MERWRQGDGDGEARAAKRRSAAVPPAVPPPLRPLRPHNPQLPEPLQPGRLLQPLPPGVAYGLWRQLGAAPLPLPPRPPAAGLPPSPGWPACSPDKSKQPSEDATSPRAAAAVHVLAADIREASTSGRVSRSVEGALAVLFADMLRRWIAGSCAVEHATRWLATDAAMPCDPHSATHPEVAAMVPPPFQSRSALLGGRGRRRGGQPKPGYAQPQDGWVLGSGACLTLLVHQLLVPYISPCQSAFLSPRLCTELDLEEPSPSVRRLVQAFEALLPPLAATQGGAGLMQEAWTALLGRVLTGEPQACG